MMERTDHSAREHVAAITAALEDGDNEGAADQAGQGLAVFPDAAVFHRLRGIALFALGANDEAKTHLAAALAVDPLDNAAIIALARLADAEDDPYTAAEHLLTAWEHDPANPDLRAALTERLATLYGPEGYLQFTRPALAALYVRNCYPERAAREYRAVLALHPNRTDLRVAAALAQWRLGNLTETVTQCDALLAEQPEVVPARWALADATARRGNGDLAREHAKQAARFDPDGAIAHALIAGNPDAAIVDPDEPLRVPDDWRERPPPVAVATAENATPPGFAAREATRQPMPLPTAEPAAKSDTMRLVEALSGLAAALVAAKTAEPGEPEFALPGTTGLAEALAALDTPVDVSLEPSAESLPNPLDVPYAAPRDEESFAETPVQPEGEPEPVPLIAVVDEDGAIITTQPGGEPSLDATDALPTPAASLSPRGRGAAGAVHEPSSSTALMPPMPPGERPHPQAAALANARESLASAGADHDRLHTLLPALRTLVDAMPERPDSHRLLGDAYARLGLYAQAQGQYRQALLVRIAGRGAK
jgi:tetratricopeptide (TPR) repeat protein